MAWLRYKPEQGYYTRTLSFVWFATLTAAMIAWVISEMDALRIDDAQLTYWQGGVAVVAALIVIPLLYWIINRPNIADFMIATEQEMRKVNWPSRREIIGSTTVVILGTFLIAAILFTIDVGFGWFFRLIGILNTGTAGS